MVTSLKVARAQTEGLHSSIFDVESAVELGRLLNSARLHEMNMGGLLPEHPDPGRLREVLDLACGPGTWVLDMARTFPGLHLVGLDLSETMVTYAQAQASELHLGSAVSFQRGDALKPLPFPDASFDLINAKFLLEFMPRWGWLALMRESVRLLRPGGWLRMTEYELGMSNAPAHEQFCHLFLEAMHDLDRCFAADGRHLGVLQMLAPTMRAAGLSSIQQHSYVVDYSSSADHHSEWCQDLLVKARLTLPFLLQHGSHSAADLQCLVGRLEEQVSCPQFQGLWHYLTVSGQTPASLPSEALTHSAHFNLTRWVASETSPDWGQRLSECSTTVRIAVL